MRFDQKLVLVRWMLSLFEVETFAQLAGDLKRPETEGLDADNVSNLHRELVNRTVERTHLKDDDLLRYDQNIVRHTRAISERRGEPVTWKYFQYLSLLFAEIYLDRFFHDRDGLLRALNTFASEFQQEHNAGIGEYKPDDLRKIAFWNATGSGKTLLMHVNILQYRHYMRSAGRIDRDLNRVVLLTPNEGLSRQHLEEFEKSGIDADLFRKDGASLFSGKAVEVIEITKLREQMGDKTVAIEAFEGSNLVLVDEGHRGNREDGVWRGMRNRLAETGFCIEYSATFGQTIKASGSKPLEQEYAKCILFDYSYKYFYRDGYGKEYRILNLQSDEDAEARDLYLTACLLSFYQQLRIFRDRGAELAKFLIDKPLAIFVGGSVNAVRTVQGNEVSDVTSVLLFLKEFASDRDATIKRIGGLLNYEGALVDSRNRPVFGAGSFDYLNTIGLSPREAYSGALETIFNAPAAAALHVDLLKGSDGELSLRLGDNEPFGVINVGDAPKLHELCGKSGLMTAEKQFGGSVFSRINEKNSRVNILIGSRKFTEGWNSWRVSTMGLMNIGRSEGSQIIQLFGRGVRLKGLGMSLKRSSMLELHPKPPKSLRFLEMLNVFGVRADYMAQFREMLEEEGVPPGDQDDVIVLPVVSALGTKRLKVLDVPEGVDFKRDGDKPTLDLPFPGLAPVTLNCYTQLQIQQTPGAGRVSEALNLETHRLTPRHTAFFNMDEIWFALQDFKYERAWYNLNIERPVLVDLLARDDWYTLYIPAREMEFTDFGRVRRWQEIAIALLKKYAERLYLYRKAEFERPHTRYRELTPDDPNFIKEYRILADRDQEELAAKLKDLKTRIESGQLRQAGWSFGSLVALGFSQHLYQPLLHVKDKVLEITPVSLNAGERDFVDDLRRYYESTPAVLAGREMYLLRNMSRGRGIGFFEAGNFYPDFILWVVDGSRQFVTFIDPKGIRNLAGLDDPKIAFYQTIKELQVRLDDPSVVLNSFIISTTPFRSVGWWAADEKAEFGKRHVLFQSDDKTAYISSMFGAILTARPGIPL